MEKFMLPLWMSETQVNKWYLLITANSLACGPVSLRRILFSRRVEMAAYEELNASLE